MMHCTNCMYFWTPCDFAFSRGLAEGLSHLFSKLCRQFRSGQTSSHLISSSGSGLVSSILLSHRILLFFSYTLTCFVQNHHSILCYPSSTSASRLSQTPLHCAIRSQSQHRPSHSHSLDPLARATSYEAQQPRALDGRPSVIPWLRRLSSPTAIKFRRSRWHRTETKAT